eukprot:SAG11_NODE_37723_length_255_cov_1.307692_1_plen_22_part_10
MTRLQMAALHRPGALVGGAVLA